MASTKRTWLWIVLGIMGFCFLAVVVLVAGTAFVVSRHVHTELAATATAERQFTEQRQRFAGQQPLVELHRDDTGNRRDDRVIVHRPPATAPRRSDLRTLRALVYDQHEGRLVHVDVPLWLLRLLPSGRSRASSSGDRFRVGADFDFGSNNLTIDDVERHGPGLIVDGIDSRGAQVLVWAE